MGRMREGASDGVRVSCGTDGTDAERVFDGVGRELGDGWDGWDG